MTYEDAPLTILSVADRALAESRLSHGEPAVSKCVQEVFDAPDPQAKFGELARSYLRNFGKDIRAESISTLAWGFGANRAQLKKLLRQMGIVGQND